MVAFKPVIEAESPTAFLTAHPLTSVSEQSTKTPLLFGLNYDDGAMKSARRKSIDNHLVCTLMLKLFFSSSLAMLNIPGLFDSFAQNVSFALPVIMEYAHLEPAARDSITNKFIKFYFDNQIKKEKMENLTNVIQRIEII